MARTERKCKTCGTIIIEFDQAIEVELPDEPLSDMITRKLREHLVSRNGSYITNSTPEDIARDVADALFYE